MTTTTTRRCGNQHRSGARCSRDPQHPGAHRDGSIEWRGGRPPTTPRRGHAATSAHVDEGRAEVRSILTDLAAQGITVSVSLSSRSEELARSGRPTPASVIRDELARLNAHR